MDLKDYCSIRGNQAKLSKKTGIAPSFINQMARGLKPVPVRYAALIEECTCGQVSRKDMFPKDWRDIWPELKEPPC